MGLKPFKFQLSKKKQNLCMKELTTVGFFRRPFSTICCKSSHSSCKKGPCIKENNVVGEEGAAHMNGAIKQIKNGRANLQYLVHMVMRYSYFINVNVINQVVDEEFYFLMSYIHEHIFVRLCMPTFTFLHCV